MSTFAQKLAGIFHLGRLPAALRAQLEAEGRILYLADGIAETAVFKDFRAPGVYCSSRYTSFIGFFVLTEKRIVARAKFYNQINFNIAYDDPKFRDVTFVSGPKLLSLAFDASLQSPEMSGRLELRLHLPDISTAAQVLQKVGAQVELKSR